MAVDMFMKFDGIDGEVTDKEHENWIEVDSWSWGETQTGTKFRGAGGGAGKVSMQDFHFVGKLDKSSPMLFQACATGEHIKKATLSLRSRPDDPTQPFRTIYMKYELTDCLISSYSVSGGGGGGGGTDMPVENLSLNFAKIELNYSSQSSDGRASSSRGGWDVGENKKF